jgi:hypothetical protein
VQLITGAPMASNGQWERETTPPPPPPPPSRKGVIQGPAERASTSCDSYGKLAPGPNAGLQSTPGGGEKAEAGTSVVKFVVQSCTEVRV